jgi:hypothetical protein
MYGIEFQVYNFVEDDVDYGFYINAHLTDFDINGEDDVQNDEINEVFAKFGKHLDFRDIVLKNNGYVDSADSWGGNHDEYFFKNEEDAKNVSKYLQELITEI